jgi:hypothetical protein
MEMLESRVKRIMREWTEKHIIELIKQHSGGGIVTPPFKEIGLLYTAYDNHYVDIFTTLNIREISNVAAKILHLDTSEWRNGRVLKSTLDPTWNDGGRIEVGAEGMPVSAYDLDAESYTCFLVPSPNVDSNHYNTYSQFEYKIRDGLTFLPDFLPFMNFETFNFSGFQYGYGIENISMMDVNSIIKTVLNIDDDLLVGYNEKTPDGKSIWDTYTKVNGYLEDEKHYFRKDLVPATASLYVSKAVFQKWFKTFNSMEIYIEVLNAECIIRPDEIPQEGRVFYGGLVADAYEYPDGW